MGRLYEIMDDHKKIKKMLKELEAWAKKEIDLSLYEIKTKIKEIGIFWNEHEKREEELFKDLIKNNIKIPFEKMNTAHKQITGHWKVILSALNSKKIDKLKLALDTDGRMFVRKIKEHMKYEEPIFKDLNFNLPFSPD